jgi:hypothetical protein
MAFVNLASILVRLAALFLVLSLGLLPLAASATIYKWTDENGVTVYSNRAPAAEAKVSNVQVALEDERPAAAPRPANASDLQERVRALEQQVQSLQGQPAAAPVPPQVPGYPAPYPAQPPPVSYYPPPDYYPPQSYPADYYSSMYGYGYPYYPYAYPTIIVTGRRFARPVHPVHPVHPGFVGRPVARPVPVSHAMGAAGVTGGSRRR